MQMLAPGNGSSEHRESFINLGERLEQVLAKPWVPHLVNLMALLLLTFSMAKWTWLLFAPAAPQVVAPPASVQTAQAPAYNLQAILSAHLFGVAPTPTMGGNIEDIPLSSLNLALTGLVSSGDASFALIRVEGQPEAPFAIGEEITAGAVLQGVFPDRAIILRNGVAESLLLEGAAQAVPGASAPPPAAAAPIRGTRPEEPVNMQVHTLGPNSYSIGRADFERQMRNPQKMLSQSLMVPNEDGGFVVREIKPGSIYEQLGLQVGDVIRGANGQDLNSMEDVMKLYQQSRNSSFIQLDILRDGRMETLQYTLQ